MSATLLDPAEQRGSVVRQTRPVRVSFLIDDLSRAGTETQLLALIRALDREVFEPTLVLLNGEGAGSRSLEPADCPVLRLGVTKLFDRRAVAAAKRLYRFWRDHRPDVAQLYFLDSAYLGVPVAKLAGVKRVVRVRNNLGYWQTRKHRVLSRLIRPWVDATLTNSEQGRAALANSGRVVVIENGVDLDKYMPPGTGAKRPGRVGGVRVGCVANLRAVKNIDGLMRAARDVLARHPDVVFEVAGDGEQRSALEQLHRELGLGERFALRGSVADVPAFLRSIDVAVLPSHSEGMSNAVLEYMAAGLPIVATGVGANPRLIEHGVCGLIVPPNDHAALVDAITRLIARTDEGVAFGEAARRRVESDHSREAMVRRFERFYLELVGRA